MDAKIYCAGMCKEEYFKYYENYHDIYVEFETAKLLKSAGFNWKVRYRYWIDPRMPLNQIPYVEHYKDFFDSSQKWYPMPTLAAVQDWLRIEKNIIIVVCYDPTESDDKKYYCEIFNPSRDIINESYAKSYNESIELGFQYVLKLLTK